MISGFGKFQVRNKNARRDRNPHACASLMLFSRIVITFMPSRLLRDKIKYRAAWIGEGFSGEEHAMEDLESRSEELYARVESIRDHIERFLASGLQFFEVTDANPPFLLMRTYERSYKIMWHDGILCSCWDPLERAYHEGNKACMHGLENPYPEGPLHDEWVRGYDDQYRETDGRQNDPKPQRKRNKSGARRSGKSSRRTAGKTR